MNAAAHDKASRSFEQARPDLIRVAYRMLGSVADSEDVVQAAFMRWNAADRGDVQHPDAYLRRIVTRLCLDALRTAKRRREVYIGAWLPDPIVEENPAEDITVSLMLALERLSPLERAAFLLHDVFGVNFNEVARTIDRTPAAARQLASRARANVRKENSRFKVDEMRGKEIAAAFFEASRNGDIAALRTMLGEDISLHADGGGKRSTIEQPICGLEAVLQVQTQFADQFRLNRSVLLRIVRISGLPGFISREADGEIQTTSLEIENDLIRAIYVVRNPAKLRHLSDIRLCRPRPSTPSRNSDWD